MDRHTAAPAPAAAAIPVISHQFRDGELLVWIGASAAALGPSRISCSCTLGVMVSTPPASSSASRRNSVWSRGEAVSMPVSSPGHRSLEGCLHPRGGPLPAVGQLRHAISESGGQASHSHSISEDY
nr:hypothetical protein GCM10017547_14730 [Pseudarthrobacter oxydans]